MDISTMHEIAMKVYNRLHHEYPNYSKETICNNALLELNDNLELNIEGIICIIKPKLENYQIRKRARIKYFLSRKNLKYEKM